MEKPPKRRDFIISVHVEYEPLKIKKIYAHLYSGTICNVDGSYHPGHTLAIETTCAENKR